MIGSQSLVVGLESSGLHSNGYSLVRKVFTRKELVLHAKELLKPTRLYARGILALKKKVAIKGIANITGGAFYDKIPRIIPKGLAIEIDKWSWPIPWIFSLIRERGNIDDRQMYRTLNMGIGMVLVVGKREVDITVGALSRSGYKAHIIGKVIKGKKEVIIKA